MGFIKPTNITGGPHPVGWLSKNCSFAGWSLASHHESNRTTARKTQIPGLILIEKEHRNQESIGIYHLVISPTLNLVMETIKCFLMNIPSGNLRCQCTKLNFEWTNLRWVDCRKFNGSCSAGFFLAFWAGDFHGACSISRSHRIHVWYIC